MIRDLSDEAREVFALAEAHSAAAGQKVVFGDSVLLALAWMPAPRGSGVFERLGALRGDALPAPFEQSGPKSARHRPCDLENYNYEVLKALLQAWRYGLFLHRLPPGPELVLLGLLWDKSSVAAQMAAEVGLTFEDALPELTGLSRPPRGYEPEPPLRIPTGERVEFPVEKLPRVLVALRKLLPDDAPHAFNHDYRTAYIRLDKGLEHIARQAVADADSLPSPVRDPAEGDPSRPARCTRHLPGADPAG